MREVRESEVRGIGRRAGSLGGRASWTSRSMRGRCTRRYSSRSDCRARELCSCCSWMVEVGGSWQGGWAKASASRVVDIVFTWSSTAPSCLAPSLTNMPPTALPPPTPASTQMRDHTCIQLRYTRRLTSINLRYTAPCATVMLVAVVRFCPETILGAPARPSRWIGLLGPPHTRASRSCARASSTPPQSTTSTPPR